MTEISERLKDVEFLDQPVQVYTSSVTTWQAGRTSRPQPLSDIFPPRAFSRPPHNPADPQKD